MNPQSASALEVANERRFALAAAKRRVREAGGLHGGMAQLADELEADQLWPKHLRVEEVLCWPKWSQPAIRRGVLRHVGVSEHGTVAGLSERQRGVLVLVLREPSLWRGRRAA